MKAVMISIQPKWCALIMNGEKTIEVRKSYPKECLEKYYGKQSDFFRERPSYKIKPFKCYIYATKSKRDERAHVAYHSFSGTMTVAVGKVIGEFVCDKIDTVRDNSTVELEKGSCLTHAEIVQYANPKNYVVRNRLCLTLYAWHITDLKIYDEPKELSEFFVLRRDISTGWLTDYHEYENYLTRPPQSWQYCEELEEKK